jgi:translation initiation factor 2 subunit 2
MSAEELNNTGAEEPMFAGLKKKSKKAKVNFDDFMSQDAPTTAADAATATIAESEEKIDAGEEGGAPADAPAADDGGDMFADLKKKSKKKKKEIPLDLVSTSIRLSSGQ